MINVLYLYTLIQLFTHTHSYTNGMGCHAGCQHLFFYWWSSSINHCCVSFLFTQKKFYTCGPSTSLVTPNDSRRMPKCVWHMFGGGFFLWQIVRYLRWLSAFWGTEKDSLSKFISQTLTSFKDNVQLSNVCSVFAWGWPWSWIFISIYIALIDVFIVCFYSLRWSESLKIHAVTTQLIIIGNVQAFLQFLLEAELPEVKAPRKLIRGVLFTLKYTLKMSRKDLKTHRQSVRIKKSGRFTRSLFSQSINQSPTW